MGEFAKVIRPHLDAHGIEGPGELARRLRDAGHYRVGPEVGRWMSGDPGVAGPGDVLALERVLGLKDEETDAVEEAFIRDVRTRYPQGFTE